MQSIPFIWKDSVYWEGLGNMSAKQITWEGSGTFWKTVPGNGHADSAAWTGLQAWRVLLCSCSELLRKLQKESSTAWVALPGSEMGFRQTGQFREHRLWNALLKTKLHCCLHSTLFWVPENSIVLLKRTKKCLSLQNYQQHPSIFIIFVLFL